MHKKTVRDIDVKNKTVLVRVDYNVPIKNGVVGDPLRIQSSFETINYLLEQNCRIVLMSHLGRPDGKVNPEYSLEPVAKKASQLLGRPIGFVNECVGPHVQSRIHSLKVGEIILLENLRFHGAEEENDDTFARELASLGQVYVDDAFAAIHRAHASTVGVTKYLPAVSGLLVEREVEYILGALNDPNRPLLAIVGGAKVSTKIEVLTNLLKSVDRLLIGGAMANTFFAAKNYNVGRSVYEPDFVTKAIEIMEAAKTFEAELILPTDVVVAKSLEDGSTAKAVEIEMIEPDDIIVDIGPTSVRYVFEPGHAPATVIWNGPVGITEVPAFAEGSRILAECMMASDATTIIGGGDTAAFIDESGWHDRFTWVSTGGGASLELMSGKELPGIVALQDK